MREPAERLDGMFREAGVASHLEVVPGLGHAFPEDFADRLPEALSFVLGPGR